MYNALILIDPSTPASIVGLKTKIKQVFTGSLNRDVADELAGNELKLFWLNFTFTITYADASHVLAESREIAEKFAKKHVARNRIEQCQARFEIFSDEDPHKTHFNEYIFIIESAECLGPVYTFEPASGNFI